MLEQIYTDLLSELDIAQGGEMVYRFCDKGHNHTYLPFYERYFEPQRARARVLEIGIMTGGSLLLWQRYFDQVFSTAIDLRPGYNDQFAWQDQIRADIYWNTDTTSAAAVPDIDLKFDFVIDDGDHSLEGQWSTFENYWPFVDTGGTYFIEDIENEHNAQELRARIETQFGNAVSIEHYRGRVNQRADDQILAITRK